MSASKQKVLRKFISRARERGSSLIEVMIASLVLLVGILPLVGVFSVAVATNSGQGDIANRTALNAQDKMEQLLALGFSDAASNTTVYPTWPTGGTGLGGVVAPSTTVGGTNPAAPVAGYVDYLTFQGVLQTTATGAMYRRQWSISTDVTGNLKTITVLVTVPGWSGRGVAPSTALVCMKSNN
jgi:Tfp pilus assembly protein PilV